MTNTTASDKLNARIAALSTAQLEAAARDLYASPRVKSEEERLVAARIADELTRRWDIEAELDRVFADEEFYGTYYEAMLIAREARHRA